MSKTSSKPLSHQVHAATLEAVRNDLNGLIAICSILGNDKTEEGLVFRLFGRMLEEDWSLLSDVLDGASKSEDTL